MPSVIEAAPAQPSSIQQAVPAEAADAVSVGTASHLARELAQASRALWSATLSLMTAYMHTQAPAHRYLLARRIATNFTTLAAQDCFDAACRERFGRLADRWQATSAEFAPETATAARPRGLLRFLS